VKHGVIFPFELFGQNMVWKGIVVQPTVCKTVLSGAFTGFGVAKLYFSDGAKVATGVASNIDPIHDMRRRGTAVAGLTAGNFCFRPDRRLWRSVPQIESSV
jgi:hypothetical protein